MSIDFDPNDIAVKNGSFMGLPYSVEEAEVVILPAPWDVTVSYGEGTRFGPQQVLDASLQLDLVNPLREDAEQVKIANMPVDITTLEFAEKLRAKAKTIIEFYEDGGKIEASAEMQKLLEEVNHGCARFHSIIEEEASKLLKSGKKVVLLGGDHSTPLGMMKACVKQLVAGDSFDILHLDAHADLRIAFEGFKHSHASIMYNALQELPIGKLVQVGIRDLCPQERDLIASDSRIECFYDWKLKSDLLGGESWKKQVEKILSHLGDKVYLSFDIDGLDPKYCPNTGTPVPGGMSYDQWSYLFTELLKSDKKIIGADLVEVSNPFTGDAEASPSEWDANVGARILFQICLGLSKQ